MLQNFNGCLFGFCRIAKGLSEKVFVKSQSNSVAATNDEAGGKVATE